MLRKKIITIMLLLLLFFTKVVFAETVSSDLDVQQAYDEYLLLASAYNGTSYTNLCDAYDAFFYTTEAINNDESKSEEWTKVVTDHVGLTEFLDVTLTSAMIIQIAEAKSEFENDKNSRTAFEFVNKYNEDLGAANKLKTMDSSLDTVYSEALTLLPSENVLYVKEEFDKIRNELNYGIIADTIKVYEESKLIETYTTLTSDEINQLAILLDIPVEELDGIIKYWWNLFKETAEILIKFKDYNNDLNLESANDFIKSVDEFLAKSSTYKSLLENYIDVDSNYEYAKAYVQAATIFNEYNAITNGYVNNDVDAIISIVENSTIDYDNLQDFSEDILDELAYMMEATKEEAIEELRTLWNDANNLVATYEAFTNFNNNQTKENAEELITVVNNKFNGKVDDLEELIPNISKKYAEAIKIATTDESAGKPGNAEVLPTPDSGKEEENNNNNTENTENVENTDNINTGANNNDTIGYNPQTGDNIVVFAILLLISIIGIAVTGKAKQ